MKVPRSAWKPGAFWTTTTDRGTLEAIIVGPSRPGNKIVHMIYTSGYGAKWGAVQQEYSHAHMLKYFSFTGENKPIPKYEPKKDWLDELKETDK